MDIENLSAMTDSNTKDCLIRGKGKGGTKTQTLLSLFNPARLPYSREMDFHSLQRKMFSSNTSSINYSDKIHELAHSGYPIEFVDLPAKLNLAFKHNRLFRSYSPEVGFVSRTELVLVFKKSTHDENRSFHDVFNPMFSPFEPEEVSDLLNTVTFNLMTYKIQSKEFRETPGPYMKKTPLDFLRDWAFDGVLLSTSIGKDGRKRRGVVTKSGECLMQNYWGNGVGPGSKLFILFKKQELPDSYILNGPRNNIHKGMEQPGTRIVTPTISNVSGDSAGLTYSSGDSIFPGDNVEFKTNPNDKARGKLRPYQLSFFHLPFYAGTTPPLEVLEYKNERGITMCDSYYKQIGIVLETPPEIVSHDDYILEKEINSKREYFETRNVTNSGISPKKPTPTLRVLLSI